MDLATQSSAATTTAPDALIEDDKRDHLQSDSEWMQEAPAAAGAEDPYSSPNEEKDAYNAELRAKKKKARGDIEHKELWSSKGSRSKRTVKRFKGEDRASDEESLFGGTFSEQDSGDVGTVIDLGKAIKKRLPGGKPSKVGKALSSAAGKVGRWGNKQKDKLTATKDKLSERLDPGEVKADIKDKAAVTKLKAKHAGKKAYKKVIKREDTDDTEHKEELKALKEKQARAKQARKQKSAERKAAESEREKQEDDNAEIRDRLRKSNLNKRDKALNREERADKGRRSKKGKRDKSAKGMLKGAFNGDSLGFGAMGDESGVEISDFSVDQTGNRYGGANATSERSSFKADDGTVHSVDKAGYRAGSGTGTSVYDKRMNNGAEEEAGAHATANAGIQASASTDSYDDGKGTRGARASSAFRAGAGASATAGARSSKKLGGRFSGVAETSAEAESFVGLDTEAGASVHANKYSAKAAANAKVGLGARIKGKAGANAALKVGKTDLLAVRGKGQGEAFAGAEAEAEGSASASLLTGVDAKGSAEAMAGAKAEGEASAGVTVGGVDGDVKAKGEAFAGAKAGAEGGVAVSALGVKAGGKAEAFAGAKAEGEVGFDFGAGGLNLGELIISGKAMAGAGANGSFNLTAMAGKLSAGAEAGAAVGVGVGCGVQFKADALFPVRLIVDQVAKNGAAVAGDNAASDTSGTKWCYEVGARAAGGGGPAKSKRSRSGAGRPKGAAGAGAAPPAAAAGLGAGAAAPELLSAAAPALLSTGPTSAAESLSGQGPPAQLELLAAAKGQASQEIKDAFDEVGTLGNDAVSRGATMLGEIGPAMLVGMLQAEEAHAKALGAINGLLASAGDQAGKVSAGIMGLVNEGLKEIQNLITTPLHDLLSVDLETHVELILARIRAAIARLKASVVSIIEKTEAMVITLGLKLGETILAPIKGIANTVGKVISNFGGELMGSGTAMVQTLQDAFGPAESGIPLEGLPGTLRLAEPVSPKLADVSGTVGQAAAFFQNAGEGGLGQIVDDLAAPILQGSLAEAPKDLAKAAKSILDDVDGTVDANLKPVEAAARQIASVIAPAVNALREFLRKLAEAFGWAAPASPEPRKQKAAGVAAGAPAVQGGPAAQGSVGAGAAAAAASPGLT